MLSVTLAGARLRVRDTTDVDELLTASEALLDNPSPAIISDERSSQAAHTSGGAARWSCTAPRRRLGSDLRAPRALRPSPTPTMTSVTGRPSRCWESGTGHPEISSPPDRCTSKRFPAWTQPATSRMCSACTWDSPISKSRKVRSTMRSEPCRSASNTPSDTRAYAEQADMHVGLNEVLLERNELTDADEHLHVSADLGEDAGLPQHPYRWHVATARLRQAHGTSTVHSSCSTRPNRSTTPTSPPPCDRSPR